MEMKDYINHRKNIFKYMEDNSLFVLFAPKEGENKYQPDRNFLYATGINESRDILLMCKHDNKMFETLFIQPFDAENAKWVGRTYNKEEAYDFSGVKDIRYISEFERCMQVMINENRTVYFDFSKVESDDKLNFIDQYALDLKKRYPYITLKQGRDFLKHARTIKSESEIDEIRKAIHITKFGIEALMSNVRPGIKEYQLESYFDQAIKFNGANGYSFDTIAASGENSCCLHYSDNNSTIPDNSVILFDLGGTYNYYCADISRTFPTNGKFSDREKLIYNIVLNGQKLMFETIKPGITTRECNQVLVKYYAKELKKIGLIKEDSEVRKYYFHGVSHHLGLDCHDLCDYTPLKPGSVVSNEPGLYIPEENIGVRIEDDVLVTEDGCENLSKEIIKEVDDIEKFMKEHNNFLKK